MLFGLESDQVLSNARYPDIVKARSVLCFWAVRELNYSATELAKLFKMTQPGISKAVKRGEKIVKENGYMINDELQ